jgi:hypothetical protein
MLGTKIACGRSGLEAGRSGLVVWTVRARVESVRVPSFLLRLLARFAELTQKICLSLVFTLGINNRINKYRGMQPINH